MGLRYQFEVIENLADISMLWSSSNWRLKVIDICTSITSAPRVLQYHQDLCMAQQQVSLEVAGFAWLVLDSCLLKRQPVSTHRAQALCLFGCWSAWVIWMDIFLEWQLPAGHLAVSVTMVPPIWWCGFPSMCPCYCRLLHQPSLAHDFGSAIGRRSWTLVSIERRDHANLKTSFSLYFHRPYWCPQRHL